jgi:hypothetical protein
MRGSNDEKDDPKSPAGVASRLLSALQASEGRRRRRKRDTTADTIGFAMKRALLEQVAADAPSAEDFEEWLLQRCEERGGGGDIRAVALEILDEWRLAQTSPELLEWLERGAPSDDAREDVPDPRDRSGQG